MPTKQEYLDRVEKIIALRNLTPGTVKDYLFMEYYYIFNDLKQKLGAEMLLAT